MKILRRDGAEIEVNYIDAQIKLACDFETGGDPGKAVVHLNLALDADSLLAGARQELIR